MIQFFLFFDFIGLFLARVVLAFFILKEFKKQMFISYIYLILSFLIFLGYYSSFAFIVLILLEVLLLIRDFVFRKEKLVNLEFRFLRITLSIVFIFVGPGLLSLDQKLNIRF
jgi:hypothetical protein